MAASLLNGWDGVDWAMQSVGIVRLRKWDGCPLLTGKRSHRGERQRVYCHLEPDDTPQPLENRKSLLKMPMRPIGILVLTVLSARIVLADVCLQSDSDIRIREEGDFDTAGGLVDVVT
jgi:hypothetical protein